MVIFQTFQGLENVYFKVHDFNQEIRETDRYDAQQEVIERTSWKQLH